MEYPYRVAYNHPTNGWVYSKEYLTYSAAREALNLVESLLGLQPCYVLHIEVKCEVDGEWGWTRVL
jgi:hypothetical protein